MSHVHGSNQFWRWRFLQECIDRFVVNPIKEILQFRESLVNKRSKLDFVGSTLLHEGLPETAVILEMQQIKILLLKEPMRTHHESLCNQKSIRPISLCSANIIVSRVRSLKRVQYTEPLPFGEKELNNVFAVVGR